MGKAAWFSGAALAVASILGLLAIQSRSAEPSADLRPPRFDDAFWRTWGDGNAEVASYDLTYSRYGEPRRGTAVAIFVSETFAADVRVKSEDATRPAAGTFPVLKLNLVQDFPTGIYDYNLMTSAFVSLADAAVARAGRPAKVSFSSQEWCGQVYSQLVTDLDSVRFVGHSYFDGEADAQAELGWPKDGVAEDALLLWARGLASPVLEPGESRSVRLLRSLELSRLDHRPPAWEAARLTRASGTERVEVPAGAFEAVRLEASVEPSREARTYPPRAASKDRPGRRWTFLVEAEPPHRVLRWEREGGASGELVGARRLPYWQLNGVESVRHLEDIGLRPRPPRTP